MNFDVWVLSSNSFDVWVLSSNSFAVGEFYVQLQGAVGILLLLMLCYKELVLVNRYIS